MAVVVIARFKSGQGHGTLEDVLAAAASVVHTVPPQAAQASEGPKRSGATAVQQAPPRSLQG
jgi:hypothetical protein